MSTPSIPNPKAPPKNLQADARLVRTLRKACHNNWYPCEVAHPDNDKETK